MKPKNISKALIFTASVAIILFASGSIAHIVYKLIIKYIIN